MKKLILLSLLLTIATATHAQGLRFFGNEKSFAERSSFDVFAHAEPNGCQKSFEVSFDFSIQNADSPGAVFTLSDRSSRRALSLFAVRKLDTFELLLSEVGRKSLHTVRFPANEITGKNLNAKLKISPADKSLELKIGDDSTRIEGFTIFGKGFVPTLEFGMTDQIREIASFKMKNLRVAVDSHRYLFPLNESDGETVHDSEGKAVGHISCPTWLINDARYWQPLMKRRFMTPGGVAFSADTRTVTTFTDDSLFTFNLNDGSLRAMAFPGPKPSDTGVRLGMSIADIHPGSGTILAYELYNEESYAAIIDPATGSRRLLTEYGKGGLIRHHHTSINIPSEKTVAFFGGYGDRSYYNAFPALDYGNARWTALDFSGDTIAPRFFAASVVTPDCTAAYIFGGKGNESGNQDIGVTYFYDLYRLDIPSRKIKRILTLPTPEENSVPVRSMVLTADGKLYMLTYPEYRPHSRLQLTELDIETGSTRILADTIPITSEEIATNANLYHDPAQGKLYCVVQEFEREGAFTLSLYSLDFPPAPLQAVANAAKETQHPNRLLAILGAVAAAIIALTAILLNRRKGKNRNPSTLPETHSSEAIRDNCTPTHSIPRETAPSVPSPTDTTDGTTATTEELHSTHTGVTRPNSINLFGPFRVVDRSGRDITYMFSPTITKLFLYILVNSITGEGVLSTDLNNIFWPDKPDDKIKNLKNVTINKLRKVIQELDGISLVHSKGFFKTIISQECFCDMSKAATLTGTFASMPRNNDDADTLLTILSRGKLLSSTTDPLFDYAKQTVEEPMIKFLTEKMKSSYLTAHNAMTLRICNILFSIDPLSEEALAYAVATLRRESRNDRALNLYNRFTKEYRWAMGEPYPTPFEALNP